MTVPRQLPQTCIALVKEFEKCVLTAYKPTRHDVWTIGWGHTGHMGRHGLMVKPGLTISQIKADSLLATDLASAGAAVLRLADVPLTDGQYGALTSFVFNLGAHRLAGSTLLERLNQGDIDGAAGQFGRWVHQGAVVLPGLVRRRWAEANLFKTPDPAPGGVNT